MFFAALKALLTIESVTMNGVWKESQQSVSDVGGLHAFGYDVFYVPQEHRKGDDFNNSPSVWQNQAEGDSKVAVHPPSISVENNDISSVSSITTDRRRKKSCMATAMSHKKSGRAIKDRKRFRFNLEANTESEDSGLILTESMRKELWWDDVERLRSLSLGSFEIKRKFHNAKCRELLTYVFSHCSLPVGQVNANAQIHNEDGQAAMDALLTLHGTTGIRGLEILAYPPLLDQRRIAVRAVLRAQRRQRRINKRKGDIGTVLNMEKRLASVSSTHSRACWQLAVAFATVDEYLSKYDENAGSTST